MSIEQHQTPERSPDAAPDAAPVETGADLARLLDGLTRAVLALPDVAPAEAVAKPEMGPVGSTGRSPADAFHDRRPSNVLGELGFLDD